MCNAHGRGGESRRFKLSPNCHGCLFLCLVLGTPAHMEVHAYPFGWTRWLMRRCV